MMKRCTVCRKTKPTTRFSRDASKRDNLCIRCKTCRRAAYLAKREQVAETSRRWYVINKDHHQVHSIAYYYANKKRRSAKMANWYERNKGHVAEMGKAYKSRQKAAVVPGFS
jgi:hypothetical protein